MHPWPSYSIARETHKVTMIRAQLLVERLVQARLIGTVDKVLVVGGSKTGRGSSGYGGCAGDRQQMAVSNVASGAVGARV